LGEAAVAEGKGALGSRRFSLRMACGAPVMQAELFFY